MKTNELLDGAKLKLGLSSDYALAKAMGIRGTGKIANYRAGRNSPDEAVCFQLAEILEIEPSAIIAMVRLEAEREPAKIEFWKRQATRYALAAGVVAALSSGGAGANIDGYTHSGVFNSLCIMRNRTTRKRKHWQVLTSIVLELMTWIVSAYLPRGMVGNSGKIIC